MSATDTANDAFQQSTDAAAGMAVLDGLSVPVLRALCDLNHLEDTGGRKALTGRLMADRYGRQEA